MMPMIRRNKPATGKRRALASLGVLMPAVAMIACVGPEYDGVEVTVQHSPPLETRVSPHGIEMPTGVAMLAKVVPYSRSSQPYTANNELLLSSSDSAVFEAYQARGSSQVVLTAVRPGDACLRIRVDGRQVGCLSVIVNQQEFDSETVPYHTNSFADATP